MDQSKRITGIVLLSPDQFGYLKVGQAPQVDIFSWPDAAVSGQDLNAVIESIQVNEHNQILVHFQTNAEGKPTRHDWLIANEPFLAMCGRGDFEKAEEPVVSEDTGAESLDPLAEQQRRTQLAAVEGQTGDVDETPVEVVAGPPAF